MLPETILVALLVILRSEDLALKIMEDMPPELKAKIWAEHVKNFDRWLDWLEKIEKVFKPVD